MGELARKYGSPQMPETPLELMTPRPGEGFSLFDKWIWPLVGLSVGTGASILGNRLRMRPIWAGIHYHVISGCVTMYISAVIRDFLYANRAESDAVVRHYISLHPEDFPPFERKRWAEVYQPFDPAR